MPISFVSLVYLFKEGLDKIDNLPDDQKDALYTMRDYEIENMMELQFLLSYLGNISKEDSDNMTPFELGNWYRLLKKQKAIENEREKSIK